MPVLDLYYPTQFKLVVYWRYVNDTFLLFRSTEHVEKFNKQYKNIAFASEIEENGSLSWFTVMVLYIEISRENNKLVTSIYFISKFYKCSLIDTLLYITI